MASCNHTRVAGKGWRSVVRWREGGRQPQRVFWNDRTGAAAFAADMEAREARGARSTTWTFAAHAEDVVRKVGPEWSPGTRRRVECDLRVHLLPAFGSFLLDEIGAEDFLDWRSAVLDEGLAPSSTNTVHGTFVRVLRLALAWDRLYRYPLHGVARLPVDPRDWRQLADDQVQDLVAGAPHRWANLVAFAAHAGLRAGELGGLRHEDIDWDRGVVNVRAQLVRADRVPLKTTRSRRPVPLTPDAHTALWRQVCVYGPGPRGEVFFGEKGAPFDRNSVNRLVEKLGRVIPGFHMHELRHYCATLLFRPPLSASPQEVADWLGHANSNITLRYYGHVYNGRLGRLADQVEKGLFAKCAHLRLIEGQMTRSGA